jgi:hypothetical protein
MKTRRHPRFRLGEFQVSGQLTFASEVTILDISMGGVSLRADKRLNIGGLYLLKLEGHDKAVTLTCEVAWARMTGTKACPTGEVVPVYTAGMKFVSPTPDTTSGLLSVVQALSHDDGPSGDDRRKHVRMPPGTPGLALLNFPAEYVVRTISLSGMLIECAEAVQPESRLAMVLSLPDRLDVGFRGRVVSCLRQVEGDTPHHDIGIEFVEMHDPAREALAEFITWLAAEGHGQGQA